MRKYKYIIVGPKRGALSKLCYGPTIIYLYFLIIIKPSFYRCFLYGRSLMRSRAASAIRWFLNKILMQFNFLTTRISAALSKVLKAQRLLCSEDWSIPTADLSINCTGTTDINSAFHIALDI